MNFMYAGRPRIVSKPLSTRLKQAAMRALPFIAACCAGTVLYKALDQDDATMTPMEAAALITVGPDTKAGELGAGALFRNAFWSVEHLDALAHLEGEHAAKAHAYLALLNDRLETIVKFLPVPPKPH